MLKIIHKRVLGSTQDYAHKLLASYTGDVLIIADIQTAGKSRHRERLWISNKGNFHGSFIIDASKIGYTFFNINLINSHVVYAVQKTIAKFSSSNDIKVKLPNDVYYDGKKIAGILIETFYPLAIIGIGINLISSPLATSTSLKDAFGIEINNTDSEFINLIYNNITERVICY